MTGYVVHYSHGDNNIDMTDSNITNSNMTESDTTHSIMTESNSTKSDTTEFNKTDSNTTDSNMTESITTESQTPTNVPTHALITNLTECYNYTFSVEATSKHLSGISKIFVFKLGMELQLMENIQGPIHVSMNGLHYPTL